MIWDKKKLAKMECIWKYIHIIKIFARLLTHFGNFVFWFFITLVASNFRLAHLVLQNVNKDYEIFSYFHNFVAKTDGKRKMEWNKQKLYLLSESTKFLKITQFRFDRI